MLDVTQITLDSIVKIEYVTNKLTEKKFVYIFFNYNLYSGPILKSKDTRTSSKILIVDRETGFYSIKNNIEDFEQFSTLELQKVNEIINLFIKMYQKNQIYPSSTVSGLILGGSRPEKRPRQSSIERKAFEALLAYQESPDDCDEKCREKIEDFLVVSRGITRVVYRGQRINQTISAATLFFSTTKNLDVAYGDFTGSGGCCLFEIHLKNVRALDVNKFLSYSSIYPRDEEVLVLGGGSFFKDDALTELGFTETVKNVQGQDMKYFITYYVDDFMDA
jgi:hypothetical protein